MHALTLFLLMVNCFAQIRDPETGELASLKFDEKSGSYYLFGLDKMVLLNNRSYQGKFMAASDSLVFFKSESEGGKILEQEIALIDYLVLQTGANVVKNQKAKDCRKGINNKKNIFLYKSLQTYQVYLLTKINSKIKHTICFHQYINNNRNIFLQSN